ncbi:MAG: TetR/AcrR family transcriptional regulator [Clostridiales bacterium]|jgi:AcrR family transcriptional regulator|nr:TetR/AcrR family transcriptional regulator [Clostridiales bacterium]
MTLDLWDGVNDTKRAKILEGALRVFAEHGYGGAKTRDIASEAKVANGLVFYYYKDKQTLFDELVAQLKKSVLKPLDSETDDDKSIYDQLILLVEQKLTLFIKYPEVCTLFMDRIDLQPDEIAEGTALAAMYPIQLSTDELRDELLCSALNGLTYQCIDNHKRERGSEDSCIAQGIAKAREYIEFFAELESR